MRTRGVSRGARRRASADPYFRKLNRPALSARRPNKNANGALRERDTCGDLQREIRASGSGFASLACNFCSNAIARAKHDSALTQSRDQTRLSTPVDGARVRVSGGRRARASSWCLDRCTTRGRISLFVRPRQTSSISQARSQSVDGWLRGARTSGRAASRAMIASKWSA